jgi:hypothetical protein
MAFNFAAYPTGPTATSPASKQLVVQAVKLTFADFTTGGTAAIKAVLPDNSSIVGIRLNITTAFSGNGVTALNLAVGITGTATKFANHALTAITAGTYNQAALTNGFQNYDPLLNTDISLLFTGTATTGNPTAGEMYVLIEYVR